jgi:hypothetical protein
MGTTPQRFMVEGQQLEGRFAIPGRFLLDQPPKVGVTLNLKLGYVLGNDRLNHAVAEILKALMGPFLSS